MWGRNSIRDTWERAVRNQDVTPIMHIVQNFMDLIEPLSRSGLTLIKPFSRSGLTLNDVFVDHMTKTLIVKWFWEEMETSIVWKGAVDSLFRPSGFGTLEARCYRTDDVVRMDLAKWVKGVPFGEGVELLAENPKNKKSYFMEIDLHDDQEEDLDLKIDLHDDKREKLNLEID